MTAPRCEVIERRADSCVGKAHESHPVSFALWLLAWLSAAVQLAVWIHGVRIGERGGADFFHIFAAASQVWHGNARHIYEVTLFNHLPFEALLLSPLAPLGYRGAYFVVLSINSVLFGVVVHKLRLRGPWAFVACVFGPVTIAILHGQDSIFSLLALTFATVDLAEGRDVAAGVWVGLTMYKPQIALPICGLMFLWRRWRFVSGFAATAAGCLGLSIATVGFRTFVGYLTLLHSMAPSKYTIRPSRMVGVHGALSTILSDRDVVFASVFACGLVLLYAFASGRRLATQRQLALATVACCLANYHMMTTDFVTILLPLALAFEDSDPPLLWSATALFAVSSIQEFADTAPFIEPAVVIPIPLLVFFILLTRRLGNARREESRTIEARAQ